jgi:hypothetical protein
MEDDGWMSPALKSRIQYMINWSRLSDSEMKDFIASLEEDDSDFSLKSCAGRPGLFSLIHSEPKFIELEDAINNIIKGDINSIQTDLPGILKQSNDSDIRNAICLITNRVSLSLINESSTFVQAYRFVVFSSILYEHRHINAEVLWEKTTFPCSL